MAEDVVTLGGGWMQIRRAAGKSTTIPTVRIRPSGDIALSADFVRSANIGATTRANVYVSADGYRIGMRFHGDETQMDSFCLCRDGGSGIKRSRVTDGRVIQFGFLRGQSPTFAKLAKADKRDRTFEPRKDVHGMWAFDLRPCFERAYDPSSPHLLSGKTGIYRYLLENEVVYIGRGDIRSRLSSPDRRDWSYDLIEYSILNDAIAEAKWESYWLTRFQETRNRLPIFNMVGGKRHLAGDEEMKFG